MTKIKIELFDIQSNSSTSASSHPNSHGGLITSVANILQNIEKSYDKGKFLLEESKKVMVGCQSLKECSSF